MKMYRVLIALRSNPNPIIFDPIGLDEGQVSSLSYTITTFTANDTFNLPDELAFKLAGKNVVRATFATKDVSHVILYEA